MARQDGYGSGRVTAKGTRSDGRSSVSSTFQRDVTKPSAAWVPILMFALLVLGTLVIVANYVLPPVSALSIPSTGWLLAGLGMILGGIITATQYR